VRVKEQPLIETIQYCTKLPAKEPSKKVATGIDYLRKWRWHSGKAPYQRRRATIRNPSIFGTICGGNDVSSMTGMGILCEHQRL